jgi:hypothetical protein
MIMPFLRLVIIYIVVILAAVLFFNRDAVMDMFGMNGSPEPAAVAWPDDNDTDTDDAGTDANDTGAALVDPTPATTTAASSASTELQTPVATAAPVVATPAAAATPPVYPTAQTAAIPAAPVSVRAPTMQTAPAAPVTPQAAAPTALETGLANARAAYWSGDLAKAESLYMALGKTAPGNADIQGELGNLFYSQRRYSEAAAHYFMAGQQLISEGKTQQAMPLVGVLQSIAPDKAAKLRTLAGQ